MRARDLRRAGNLAGRIKIVGSSSGIKDGQKPDEDKGDRQDRQSPVPIPEGGQNQADAEGSHCEEVGPDISPAREPVAQSRDENRKEGCNLLSPPLLSFQQQQVFQIKGTGTVITAAGLHLFLDGTDVAFPVSPEPIRATRKSRVSNGMVRVKVSPVIVEVRAPAQVSVPVACAKSVIVLLPEVFPTGDAPESVNVIVAPMK